MVTFKLTFQWKDKYVSEGAPKEEEWCFGDLQILLERWNGIHYMTEWATVSRYTDEKTNYIHLDLNFGSKGFIDL